MLKFRSNRKSIIAIVVIVIGLALMIAALVAMSPGLIDASRYDNLSKMSEILSEDQISVDGVQIENSSDELDWSYLKSVNSDVKAWVTIGGTNIDYPVVQSSNNNFYVEHNFWKSWSFAGCPFLDYRSDANGRNAMIYGHNLAGIGTMFSQIHDADQQWRFDQIGSVWWATPELGSLECKPIAAMSVSETYSKIQTFDWTANSDLINSELDEIAESKSKLSSDDIDDKSIDTKSISDGDVASDANRIDEYQPTDEDRKLAKSSAETKMFRNWLKDLCADATATSSDIDSQINSAKRIVTLVSCSSNFAHQPWRMLLICVVQDQ